MSSSDGGSGKSRQKPQLDEAQTGQVGGDEASAVGATVALSEQEQAAASEKQPLPFRVGRRARPPIVPPKGRPPPPPLDPGAAVAVGNASPAASRAEVDIPPGPERPWVQQRRTLAHSLVDLMMLRDAELEHFMQKKVGPDSKLGAEDVLRARDVLNVLADALRSGDEAVPKAIHLAWNALYADPLRRKRSSP